MNDDSKFVRVGGLFVPRETEPARFAEDKPVQDQNVVLLKHVRATGSSGTCIQAGMFDEEYLTDLTGREAADKYDKMRRNDGRIAMVTKAVKNPIKGATWEFEKAKSLPEAEAEKHRAFTEHVIFNDMGKPWRQTLHEILSLTDFGYSMFEVTHKLVKDHPVWGTYNGIRNFAFRSPRTVERWILDTETGKLKAVEQLVDGDLDRGKTMLVMDARFLVVFSLDKEGDNYEGISMLRPVYGPWFRKQMFLKIAAIGMEKSAVPTPVAHIPAGKEESPQAQSLIDVLEAYTSHEMNYITLPEGWLFEFANNPFDPEKSKSLIEMENVEMVNAFLGNFLNLGQSGKGGAFALSMDLSDFFLGGLEHIANLICETFNNGVDNNLGLVEQVIRMKFGPQKEYPKMICSGITDRAGEELAIILEKLGKGNFIRPDDPTEEHLRKRLRLPAASEEGREERRAQPAPAPGNPNPPNDDEDDDDKKATDIRLAETPRGQITRSGKTISNLMTEHLTRISDNLVDRVMAKFEKLPDAAKINAIKDVHVNGLGAYKTDLVEEFALTSNQALAQAQKEVPGHNNVTLAAGVRFSEKDKLGRKRKLQINNLAELYLTTQGADLEKAVFFQFTSSLNSSFDSAIVLEQDIRDAGREFAESASIRTGANIAAAQIINETRNAFFFEPDVVEEIQSFTFTNGDPKSPICKDLAGSTFRTDDAQANRFFPPLHHNCKSILVANLSKKRPKEITGLKPSKPELEKFITLAEGA